MFFLVVPLFVTNNGMFKVVKFLMMTMKMMVMMMVMMMMMMMGRRMRQHYHQVMNEM